jgi:hypothetical protein
VAEQRLVIVSNRGPAQFERGIDGERTVHRGGGGLVTALTGLVAARGGLWIASAMTDEDVAVSREAEGEPVSVELGDNSYEVLMVESDPQAYDRFYNVIANPILWFVQHYLWDLSNAPDIRAEEKAAWEHGYKVVNADVAAAVLATTTSTPPRGSSARAGPTRSCSTSSTSPGRSPTAGGSSLRTGASRSIAACLPTTSSASTPPPTAATSCTAATS